MFDQDENTGPDDEHVEDDTVIGNGEDGSEKESEEEAEEEAGDGTEAEGGAEDPDAAA